MFIGRKITAIRTMTQEEMEREGWEWWEPRPLIIILEDGTQLYPARDERGSGPGVWFAVTRTGNPVNMQECGEE